jgi:hypothetical protein
MLMKTRRRKMEKKKRSKENGGEINKMEYCE